MSSRRRGRGKGGQNQNQGANANANQGNGQGSKGGGQSKAKKKLVDFWEVKGATPTDLAAAVSVPDDPTALVRSLGAPALPGQGANAEHYFTAVYDKASHVAYALAVANGLLAEADPEAEAFVADEVDEVDEVDEDDEDDDATSETPEAAAAEDRAPAGEKT